MTRRAPTPTLTEGGAPDAISQAAAQAGPINDDRDSTDVRLPAGGFYAGPKHTDLARWPRSRRLLPRHPVGHRRRGMAPAPGRARRAGAPRERVRWSWAGLPGGTQLNEGIKAGVRPGLLSVVRILRVPARVIRTTERRPGSGQAGSAVHDRLSPVGQGMGASPPARRALPGGLSRLLRDPGSPRAADRGALAGDRAR